MSQRQATVAIADLHLTRHSPPSLGSDLVACLKAQAGRSVVFVGDFFDLVSDRSDQAPLSRSEAILAAHPGVREALGRHLDSGGSLTFCGGNHDADLGTSSFRQTLIDTLSAPTESHARLKTHPWFFRDGPVHIEHGHFYDPDNAPAHPLVVGENSLGVHFSAEFIHPTGAHRYLNANDGAPLDLFLSAFRWYGPRAPHVIYRYFFAAISALAKSGPFYRAKDEKQIGEAKLAAFAECVGLPVSTVERVLACGAQPTLESWSATFARLYLDRVVATLLVAGGLGGLALGRRKLGGLSAGVGSLMMAASWVAGHSRYDGNVVENLQNAASQILNDSDAELVVFGHTHRESLSGGYANTGSFAFPRKASGRPFLEITTEEGRAQARRRYWPLGDAPCAA